MPWVAAIPAVAGLASSIIGAKQAQNQLDAATSARQAALQQWLAVNVPDPAQQAIELQRYQVTGQLSPELESAFQQSQTNLKNMQIDPTSRAAEVGALTQMQDVANSGGMDAEAKQQLQQGINATNANEAGQRGAIEQNFAARGVGGSGAQLAAELQASQGDANQAASVGQSAAASAEQRALQAMSASSNMASNLNSQDYTQAANAAAAQDAINRFNTQNQQQVANANVTATNNAKAANLANAQAVANANTGVANQQETFNKGLYQQQFENEARKASGSANAENGVADQANTNAQNQTNLWGNIGNAVTQGSAAIGQYMNKQNNNQNDNQESDSADTSSADSGGF